MCDPPHRDPEEASGLLAPDATGQIERLILYAAGVVRALRRWQTSSLTHMLPAADHDRPKGLGCG